MSETRADGVSPDTSNGTERSADSDSKAAWTTIDPTPRVRELKLGRKPVWVKPNATIAEAMMVMMTSNFSQLPLMKSTRAVCGIFSWRSLAQKMAFGKKPVSVEEAMEDAVVVDSSRSIFEAARLVADADCVLIKESDGTISKILTAYDLSVDFAERSEPFLLLEQIETHIRNHLNARIPIQEMRQVRDPLESRKAISDASGLSFGDYVRILQKPECWQKLGLPLDPGMFIKDLDEVRDIRNRLMHFAPNGLAPDDLGKLREIAGLLTKIHEVMM
jgi:hypothetical protein